MTTDIRLFTQPKPQTLNLKRRLLFGVGLLAIGFLFFQSSPILSAFAADKMQGRSSVDSQRLATSTAEWELFHAFLETVPAPTTVCFTNPYTEVDWQDHFYYGENPDLSARENTMGCTNLKDKNMSFASTAEYLDTYYAALNSPSYVVTTTLSDEGVYEEVVTYPTDLMDFNDLMKHQYALMLLVNTPYEQS